MPEPTRIFDTATAVLTAVQTFYVTTIAAQAPTLDAMELPEEQFIADGLPSWDCPMLCVAVSRTIGIDGDVSIDVSNPVQCAVQRAAEIEVLIVRCAPVMGEDGSPPPGDEISDSARLVLTDAQMMWSAVLAANRAGDLGPKSQGMSFLEWLPQGPAGDLVGGKLRIRVDLTKVPT